MLATYLLTASFALLTTSLASPAGYNPLSDSASGASHLEARATRSSQGWYSYGCYMDCYDGMNRYLPTFAYSDPANTPEKCISACQGMGMKYAGLQYGNECYCGDKLAGPPTKPSECDHKCVDGSKCGGPCRNNIWSALQKAHH